MAANGAAIGARTEKLRQIDFTVNVWFLSFPPLESFLRRYESGEKEEPVALFLIAGPVGPMGPVWARFNRFGPFGLILDHFLRNWCQNSRFDELYPNLI